jgi:hypothetical protein
VKTVYTVFVDAQDSRGFAQRPRLRLDSGNEYPDGRQAQLGVLLIHIENMQKGFEDLRSVSIELNGARHEGQYRVMGRTVIVYFRSEIKSGDYGMDRPEVVARWILSDLARRLEGKGRRSTRRWGR